MTVGASVKQTLANLKGAQGTLRTYSIKVQDESARSIYAEALMTTNKVIDDLNKRLKTIELEEPQYRAY
ncbi:DUF1657 domain-containing protein [Lutibacter sp. B2]|nr:DUF1657 domain-containing protein [Lutibacter sp. B2]